jgi:hypothetical protein
MVVNCLETPNVRLGQVISVEVKSSWWSVVETKFSIDLAPTDVLDVDDKWLRWNAM